MKHTEQTHCADKRTRITRKHSVETAPMVVAGSSDITTPQDFRAIFAIDNGTDDLDLIPPEIQTRAFAFLVAYKSGAKYPAALDLAKISPWEISRARNRSKTFKAAMDEVRDVIALHYALRTETTLFDTANGEYRHREGYLDPDTKAASMVMSANDPKYKPGASVPITAISIQLDI